MRLRFGIDWELEDQATAQLMQDRKDRGVYSAGRIVVDDENYPWLNVKQMEERQRREVFNANGYPDAAIVEGRFWRAHNPMLGCHVLPKTG